MLNLNWSGCHGNEEERIAFRTFQGLSAHCVVANTEPEGAKFRCAIPAWKIRTLCVRGHLFHIQMLPPDRILIGRSTYKQTTNRGVLAKGISAHRDDPSSSSGPCRP